MSNEEFVFWVKTVGGTGAAAALLGITPAQVSNYIHGRRNIGAKMLSRIEALNVKLSTPSAPAQPNARMLTDDEVVWIPLYERRVNAGVGIDLEVPGVLKAPELRSKIKHPDKTYAVMVSGDSMAARGITEESIVTCERVDSAHIDRYVNKVVLAGYEGAAYIKLLIKRDGRYYLHSQTIPEGKYEDIDLDPQHDWKIFAVMLHFTTRG